MSELVMLESITYILKSDITRLDYIEEIQDKHKLELLQRFARQLEKNKISGQLEINKTYQMCITSKIKEPSIYMRNDLLEVNTLLTIEEV